MRGVEMVWIDDVDVILEALARGVRLVGVSLTGEIVE